MGAISITCLAIVVLLYMLVVYGVCILFDMQLFYIEVLLVISISNLVLSLLEKLIEYIIS